MGGFRAPIFSLGISAPAGGAQAGIRSLLAPWLGGAGAPSLARPGFRSLLAPWLGGACAIRGIPIPVSDASGNGTILAYLEFQKNNLPAGVQNDDEEVMDFLRIWTIWYNSQ